MNWKLIVVGGIVFYVVMFIISLGTGPLIHGPNGVLSESYKANAEFWRPELNQDPPDMGALMPQWIATGLLTAFIMAAIYGCVRSAFSGPAWKKGLYFGAIVAVLACCFMAGWSGIFNLPAKIWLVWGIEFFAYYLIGGAALGWVAQKVAPESAAA